MVLNEKVMPPLPPHNLFEWFLTNHPSPLPRKHVQNSLRTEEDMNKPKPKTFFSSRPFQRSRTQSTHEAKDEPAIPLPLVLPHGSLGPPPRPPRRTQHPRPRLRGRAFRLQPPLPQTVDREPDKSARVQVVAALHRARVREAEWSQRGSGSGGGKFPGFSHGKVRIFRVAGEEKPKRKNCKRLCCSFLPDNFSSLIVLALRPIFPGGASLVMTWRGGREQFFTGEQYKLKGTTTYFELAQEREPGAILFHRLVVNITSRPEGNIPTHNFWNWFCFPKNYWIGERASSKYVRSICCARRNEWGTRSLGSKVCRE